MSDGQALAAPDFVAAAGGFVPSAFGLSGSALDVAAIISEAAALCIAEQSGLSAGQAHLSAGSVDVPGLIYTVWATDLVAKIDATSGEILTLQTLRIRVGRAATVDGTPRVATAARRAGWCG